MTEDRVTDSRIRSAALGFREQLPPLSETEIRRRVQKALGISSSRYHAALRPKQPKPGYPAGKPRTYRLRAGCEQLVESWRSRNHHAFADDLEDLLTATKPTKKRKDAP